MRKKMLVVLAVVAVIGLTACQSNTESEGEKGQHQHPLWHRKQRRKMRIMKQQLRQRLLFLRRKQRQNRQQNCG